LTKLCWTHNNMIVFCSCSVWFITTTTKIFVHAQKFCHQQSFYHVIWQQRGPISPQSLPTR